MSQFVGVKFRDFGQIYYFDAQGGQYRASDRVVVETENGLGLGTVAVATDTLPEALDQAAVKPVARLATEEDLTKAEANETQAREAFKYCRQRIAERELDMKLTDVEAYFDGSKIVFYFTAPGRVDFRELVKDLVRTYRTRIELRQIGVRHETQMLGAIGNCGQVCCCRRFLRKFEPVTIKMAKEQNLFLNPTKISGICGRLLCCLSYEQKNYEQFQKKCPKAGKRFSTGLGMVRVLRTNFFRQSLSVLTEAGEERELTLDEWAEIREQQAPEAPAAPEAEQQRPPKSKPPRQPKPGPQKQAQQSPPAEAEPAPDESQSAEADAAPDAAPGDSPESPENGQSHGGVFGLNKSDGQRRQDNRPKGPRPDRKPKPQKGPKGNGGQNAPNAKDAQASPAAQEDGDKPKRKRPSRRRRRRKPKGGGQDGGGQGGGEG